MRFSRTWYHPAQLEFVFEFASVPLVAMDDEDDDLDAFCFPVRLIVSAAGLQPPETRAPRSVFDLANMQPPATRMNCSRGTPGARHIARIEVADGVTRLMGAAYPSRWTPEDEERERQRRARQRPPKPVKGARTRSRKLLEMVGGD